LKISLSRLPRTLSTRLPRIPGVTSHRPQHASRRGRVPTAGAPVRRTSADRRTAMVPCTATPEVNWRRNLAALWIAEFFAIFGFSFVGPFMPLYLHVDLGLANQHDVAFWTGLCTGVSGLTMAVASPIWGVLADRYGRKQMLLRAAMGGAVSILLMSLVHAPWQLAGIRILQGATSGTVAAATALVAAETPRSRVVWALGVLSSAIALGSAAGPMIGGLAAAFLGLRWIFLCGGLLLALSLLPVLVIVRESRTPQPVGRRAGSVSALRAAGRPVLLALGVLIGGQCLMQFSYISAQQMVVLRMAFLDPDRVNLMTGVAFGLAGVATAIASASYARVARWFGYRGFASAAALGLAAVIAAGAFVPSMLTLVAVIVGFGMLYGLINPILSGMIGLRAPSATQSTVYGISSSAISTGMALGPLLAGTLAAASTPSNGLLLGAGAAGALFVLLAVGLRNPPDTAAARARPVDPTPSERPAEQQA
jgi:MFS transporter, DHA1 family, multidrug resistance protein